MEATLIEVVARPENAMLMAAVWAVLATVRKMVPKAAEHPIYARALPVLPLLLCVGGMFLPGVSHAEMSIGDKIILGLVLGYALGHSHKVIRQTLAGADQRIS